VQNTKTIKLKLDRYQSFGELGGYEETDILKLINYLESQDIITIKKEQGHFTVYHLTNKGQAELKDPRPLDLAQLETIKQEQYALNNPFTEKTVITEQDKQLFSALQSFFPHFNDEQKKAVTSPAQNILCVAGAGSGKTSVLTKRAAFLIQYKSVAPERILAITFTRKARKEMQERLAQLLPNTIISIETFNSFAEKELQKKGMHIYEEQVTMASQKEQLSILMEVLRIYGHSPASIVKNYFTQRQQQGKDQKTLFFSFAYDFHAFVDRLRITNTNTETLRSSIKNNQEHAPLAKLLIHMAQTYLTLLRKKGLRDYTDQLVDVIHLYEQYSKLIPQYDYLLVDEYQDVNDQQIRLIELLQAQNLFVVGDPRQSIYGWRGSKMNHILSFPQKYPHTTIIQLIKNYRSTPAIVKLCNKVIETAGYPNLESTTEDTGNIILQHYATEDEQASAITQKIKSYEGNKKDIFVLARTNKTLDKFKDYFAAHAISYLLRTDEQKNLGKEAEQNQVTLATVHAIKGLEAKEVYLVNANTMNFPCKASDHPVMELFHLQEDYDAKAEELRVLYVALSRAKEMLHIGYTGALTSFIPDEVIAPHKKQKQNTLKKTVHPGAMMQLRQWRYKLAKERGCPAYIICSDKTLEALLSMQPTSIEELYTIPGLGQVKIQDFGEELLLELQKI
jgi:superfamily I DNA/RNA helicase